MATLELALQPGQAPRLAKWQGMRGGRSFPLEIVWHDTPEGALAAKGRCLSEQQGYWRLTRLRPPAAAGVPETLAEARHLYAMTGALPNDLAPCARLTGRRRVLRWADGDDAVELRLLEGELDGSTRSAVCRVVLDGSAPIVAALAGALAQELEVQVPSASLAEQALAAIRGEALAPRALGAPQVHAGQSVTESLATIAGHLSDVLLYWGTVVPDAHTSEPVHQARVAIRRLRSALSLYKPVAACPELAGLTVPLKLCAARLGTARDWDVFLEGLGAHLAEAFPDDPRCQAMLRAAARRRRAAYVDLRRFLGGADFRTLTVALACAVALRPWEAVAPADGLQQNSAVFAAGVLQRALKQVRRAGRGIEDLPVPALHELRKDCKRLRYAAEFFAPLFPPKRARRFVQRLAELQDELGLLNDSAAVAGLMAQLGRLERSYAAGLVEGFSAAHAGPARGRIEQAWSRFKAASSFWTT